MKSRVEELIQIERNATRVCVKMQLNGRFIKTPFVSRTLAPAMICRLVGDQMEKLVRQRKHQLSLGYTFRHPASLQHSLRMLEYRLATRHKWSCANLSRYIAASLPDLRNIAPAKGRYAQVWHEFLIGLELIRDEENIQRKINQLL